MFSTEIPPIEICIKNNIKVYPVKHDNRHLKIEVDYDGRKKVGRDIYNWKTQQKELQKKIAELYEIIAKNIQSKR